MLNEKCMCWCFIDYWIEKCMVKHWNLYLRSCFCLVFKICCRSQRVFYAIFLNNADFGDGGYESKQLWDEIIHTFQHIVFRSYNTSLSLRSILVGFKLNVYIEGCNTGWKYLIFIVFFIRVQKFIKRTLINWNWPCLFY